MRPSRTSRSVVSWSHLLEGSIECIARLSKSAVRSVTDHEMHDDSSNECEIGEKGNEGFRAGFLQLLHKGQDLLRIFVAALLAQLRNPRRVHVGFFGHLSRFRHNLRGLTERLYCFDQIVEIIAVVVEIKRGLDEGPEH